MSKLIREVDVSKAKLLVIIYTLSVAALCGSFGSAVAKSKPTYDQAWALCTKHINHSVPKDNHSARYSAGAACMHKYGYRI
jgi:uncharacterized metal-binding protein